MPLACMTEQGLKCAHNPILGFYGLQSEWAALLSSTSSLQPSSKLPNAQAQAIALTLMAHMLSISPLAGTMLEHSNALQQAAQAAADAAAAAAAGVSAGAVPSPAPTSGQGTPQGPPDPIPIHEHLLQYFMLAPVYATPTAPTPEAGKGKKEEPKKVAGKGKGAEVGAGARQVSATSLVASPITMSIRMDGTLCIAQQSAGKQLSQLYPGIPHVHA
jgi:hypothetical protein